MIITPDHRTLVERHTAGSSEVAQLVSFQTHDVADDSSSSPRGTASYTINFFFDGLSDGGGAVVQKTNGSTAIPSKERDRVWPSLPMGAL